METRWSWVQPLYSTLASSELRYMYEVYNRGEEIGFRTQDEMCLVLTIYH